MSRKEPEVLVGSPGDFIPCDDPKTAVVVPSPGPTEGRAFEIQISGTITNAVVHYLDSPKPRPRRRKK